MELSDDIDEGRAPISSRITVLGDERLSLSRKALVAFPTEERTVTIVCSSGARHTATWTGIPVIEILSAAEVPDETTHLVVESVDGYRICVDVFTALDGLLALFRDERPIAEQKPYETRFIAPDIDGARTVKAVAVLEARQLSAGTDPETLEVLSGNSDSTA